MQLTTQVLQGGWSELLGSLLIIAGLVLATWTLGEKHVSALASGVGRLPLRLSQASVNRIDAASQLRRLADIAEGGFVRIQSVADLHARATEAVAAADDAVSRLLADCAVAFTPREREGRFELPGRSMPMPEPMARPLAA